MTSRRARVAGEAPCGVEVSPRSAGRATEILLVCGIAARPSLSTGAAARRRAPESPPRNAPAATRGRRTGSQDFEPGERMGKCWDRTGFGGLARAPAASRVRFDGAPAAARARGFAVAKRRRQAEKGLGAGEGERARAQVQQQQRVPFL